MTFIKFLTLINFLIQAIIKCGHILLKQDCWLISVDIFSWDPPPRNMGDNFIGPGSLGKVNVHLPLEGEGA